MSKLQASLVYESVNQDWDAVLTRDFSVCDGGTLQLLGIASPGLGAPYFHATYRHQLDVKGKWLPCRVALDGRVDCFNRISTRVSLKRQWKLESGETFTLHGVQATSHSKLHYRQNVVRAGFTKQVELERNADDNGGGGEGRQTRARRSQTERKKTAARNVGMPPIKLGAACDTTGKCIGVAKQGRVQVSTDWKGNWTAKVAVQEDEDYGEDWI